MALLTRPVQDIRQAVVYTINETILSDDGIDLARKTGSDVLIRGWFKWSTAPDFAKLAPLVPKAHAMGALFGGGITCSALYHGESGLTEKQVLDMATRGPAGQLIDAWGQRNCRHGTLSNPVYLEFLLSSCERQIDAGADGLFMDEINAALQANEGFDDYSVADFRKFLPDRCGKQGWTATDARWRSAYKIDLADASIAPDKTIKTFQYRAYLKSRGLSKNPHAADNPLSPDWHAFRNDRDDRAWKWLTDAIRAYAASKGRRVLINANGLARYVDLQVLGVWEDWRTKNGRIDLSDSQLDQWGSTVAAGWGMAGRKVPVVLVPRLGLRRFPVDGSPARGPPALDSRSRGGNLRGRRLLRLPRAWPVRQRRPAGRHARRDRPAEPVLPRAPGSLSRRRATGLRALGDERAGTQPGPVEAYRHRRASSSTRSTGRPKRASQSVEAPYPITLPTDIACRRPSALSLPTGKARNAARPM